MKTTQPFKGANVFMSRNLVPPEVFLALLDALKLNGAEIFLSCDPSRNGPDDFHVIASLDHENFEDLRAKGCNLIGPRCVLSCAKENRPLPKGAFTCCLAMEGLKVLASGFQMDDKVKIGKLVSAMGGVLLGRASSDVNIVVVKNVLAAKYKWALNIQKKPVVTLNWLHQCWNEHRVVPKEPYKVPPFSGLTICVTRIPADEHKEIEKFISQNGGRYSAELTESCTHLIADAAEGDKYKVARKWGHIHIVTRKWFHQSIARNACLNEESYPVHNDSSSLIKHTRALVNQNGQENIVGFAVPTSSAAAESDAPVAFQYRASDLEASISQNVCSSSVKPTAFVKEDIVGPTTEPRENNADGCVAADSGSEGNDLYLSECRIFFLGFGASEIRRLVNIVRRGGGSRYMMLNYKLTHIVVGTPSESEKRQARSVATSGVIQVVTTSWLEDCDRGRKEIPVHRKYTNHNLILPRDSVCSMKRSFAGMTETDQEKRAEIVEWVNLGGGEVINDPFMHTVHFIIECHGVSCRAAGTSQTAYVSSHWVRSCLEDGCLLDADSHILYSPLPCRIPFPGLQNFRLCVSQYEEKDRLLLRNLCFVLGAKFDEKLSRTDTHLLCKFADGPQYKAACKWGIVSVTSDWLYECVRQNQVVSPDNFHPKQMTTRDREAGCCLASQFPTQFVPMTSRDNGSPFVSKFEDRKDANGCIKGEPTSNNGCALRSEENNATGSVERGRAVPDVAAAIEDLLVQTSKIQGQNSPGRISDTTLFQPNSSATEQSNAGIHSVTGLSRHCLNRVLKNDEIHNDHNPSEDATTTGTHGNFSDTQTESQVVGYEEDLSGRQMLLERVRT